MVVYGDRAMMQQENLQFWSSLRRIIKMMMPSLLYGRQGIFLSTHPSSIYTRQQHQQQQHQMRSWAAFLLLGWIQPNPTIIFKYMHINMHHSSNLANGIGVGAKAAAGNVRSRFSFEKTRPLRRTRPRRRAKMPNERENENEKKKRKNKRERLFEQQFSLVRASPDVDSCIFVVWLGSYDVQRTAIFRRYCAGHHRDTKRQQRYTVAYTCTIEHYRALNS